MIDTAPLRRKLLDLAITGKLVPRQGEWRTVKLGEVADVQLGKRICSKTDSGRPYKFLANINVRWGEFDLSNLKETLFTEKEAAQFTLRKGDLLVCEGGVPGRCAVWQSEPTDIKFQMALHRIRPGTLLTAEYLRYYFEAVHGTLAFRQYFIGCTIYTQAKNWDCNQTVGRPELQKFLGALAGQGATRGIYITTARFSKEAREFVEKHLQAQIRLVDGSQLIKLMIEYGLGAVAENTYVTHRLSREFFEDLKDDALWS